MIATIFAEQGDAAALPVLYKMHASQTIGDELDNDDDVSEGRYLDQRAEKQRAIVQQAIDRIRARIGEEE